MDVKKQLALQAAQCIFENARLIVKDRLHAGDIIIGLKFGFEPETKTDNNMTTPPPVVADEPTEAAYEERTLQGLRDGGVQVSRLRRIFHEVQAKDLE